MRPADPDRLLLAALTFAAGFGVGLLLAPSSGVESRRRIAGGARHAVQAAEEGARGAAAPVVARARETARGLAQRHVPLADDWDVVDGRDLLRDLQRPPRS